MDKINIKNLSLFAVISIPLVQYYYLGDFRAIAGLSYFICIILILIGSNNYVNRKDLVVISICLTAIPVYFINFESKFGLILALRLNFGFLIILYALRKVEKPGIELISIILSIQTIIEYILITIKPEFIEILPNYNKISELSFSSGGVHSFGGNRTVSGVLLLSLYIYLDKIENGKNTKYLVLAASILCGSGTAYGLLLFYFFAKGVFKLRYLATGIILTYILIFSDYDNGLTLEKFNYQYILFLFNYKNEQILDYQDRSSFLSILLGLGDVAFGNPDTLFSGYGSLYGDFIILDFLSRFGILGAGCLGYFLFIHTNNYSRMPILIILLGTFHYHVLFSSPGQIIAALIIIEASMKNKIKYKLQ